MCFYCSVCGNVGREKAYQCKVCKNFCECEDCHGETLYSYDGEHTSEHPVEFVEREADYSINFYKTKPITTKIGSKSYHRILSQVNSKLGRRFCEYWCLKVNEEKFDDKSCKGCHKNLSQHVEEEILKKYPKETFTLRYEGEHIA